MKYIYIPVLLAALAFAFIAGCSADDPMSMPDQNQVMILVSPADGATNVPTTTAFVVTFDRAMDRAHVESSFQFHHGWGVGGMTDNGSFAWNQQGTVMTFQPSMPLDSNATYTLHMMGMMRGMDGNNYHPMLDSAHMGGGMMSGRMMGGMGDDEIRITCSTGNEIRRQIELNLIDAVVLVADGGSGDIAAIDPATNTLIGIQPVENVRFLHHLGLSPDSRLLTVSDPGENFVSGGNGGHGGHGGASSRSRVILLDALTLREVRRLEINGVTHNAAITPDGASLLLANANNATLLRYNFPDLTFQNSFPVGAGPLEATVAPDGRYAFTANSGAASVTRIDLITNQAAGNLNVGTTPIGAWIAPDGSTAWVTNEGSKSITIIRIDPLTIDTTIILDFTPGQAMVNPVRPEAYVADEDNGRVVIFDSRSYERLTTVTTGAGAHGVAISTDGAKVYITNEHAMSVSVIDVVIRVVETTITVGMKPNGIVYRPALATE